MDNKMKTSQMITLFTLGVSALASCGGGGDTKVVHFNVDGGTAIGDMTVPWGKNLTREDIPETTKEGHTLVNWYTDAKKTVVFTEKTVEEDITLYAKWSVNSYTVSYFDGEDGTTKLFKDKKFNYAAAVELPIPTKKNVTFAAWYTDASLSESSRVTGTYKMPSHDVRLYAEWSNNSYDVTFDPNGDDVSGQMAAVHLAYRGKITLPYNAFVRTGYEFAGWNTAPDGSGTAYADGDDVTEFEKAAGTLTLYAQWRAKAYKVKFFNNSTEIPDLELAQDYHAALSIPDDPTYVAERDGFTFQGWGRLTKVTDTEFDKSKNYFSISGTVVSALGYAQAKAAFEAELTIYEVTAFPEGYLISGDTNVYAKFARKENTIAFLSDSGVVAAIKGYFGEPVSLPTPQYAGHTFLGWYQEGSAERFDPADMKVTMPASSIVLNAKWAVNSYSVSYETNTDDSILTETLAYDTPLAQYLPDGLKKEGHTFQGWYYDAGFTQEASELDKVPDHDIVLHACWKANEVNVEYHANCGEDEQGESAHVYGEEGYVSLASLASLGFANKGYTFAGWNTQADGKGKVVTALSDDDFGEDGKTIVLYAQWIVNGYAVSYDTGAESISVNDVSLDYGTPLGDYLPNLNRGGYAFGGWFYDKECKTPVNSTDTVPDHDIKLYAKWIAKSLMVNYDLNGGEGEIDPTSHTYGEEGWNALDPTVPSYLGYTFAGWNTQADGKGKAYTALTVSDFAELSGEITLYAKWAQNVLSVSYHGNTANSGEMAESHHVYDEGDWGVLSENLFAKTGNHFVGWNTREDGKGTSYESLSASDFKETSSSLSLYAQWAPNEITVNYHANEGEGEIASTHHTYGSGEYTALTPERFSHVGYTFAGWNTKADGTGTAYANLSTADFDKDGKTIDLYAQWTINGHEVAYVPGNGETIHAIDLDYGTVLDDYLPEVSRLGYDFGGWFYDAGFEKAVKEGDTVPDADITLYAKWVAHTVKVVYDANGGTDAPASTDHVFGAEDFEKITADEPKLEGYTFLGWYRNPESTGDEVTELATSDFGKVGGEVTLYAKWAINTYKISYVTNGGSSVANQNVVYGKDVVVPETTRAGYTFAGWFYDAELKNAVKEGDKMPAENITLYAKWNANAITLHYEANGGIGAPVDSPRTFDGENYDKISTDEPTREGYTFLGWYRSTEPNAAKVEKLATADFGENGATVTVYAHWGINAYKVSYVTGTDEIIDAKNVDYGTVLADYLPELERIGYDFGGWYVDEVKYDAESTMPAGDLVLVAKWTAHTLKVTYDANYEAGPEDVIANLTYGQDGYTSVAPGNTFVREGHTFLGWEDKDGNPVTGFNDLSYAESANEITLKAKWSVNVYQVVYVTNGGSSVNVANVDYGTEVPQPSSSRAGYTFAGWFYDAELKNAVKAGDKMPASGLILYADWTANTVKVTYDANGGVNAPAQTDHTFANGADYAEISTAEPTREGYTFLGWYRSTEPNAAKVNYLATGDFKEVGGTLTIYAKWAVNAYKVSYVTGNGQVIADANVDYGTALGEYLPELERIGYDFDGWYVGEVKYGADATMPAENLTLTAKWTAHTLKVNYVSNYEAGPEDVIVNLAYDQSGYNSVAASDTFVREGYTFVRWEDKDGNPVTGFNDLSYAESANEVTLYAKWAINVYQVNYVTNGGSSVNVANVDYGTEIPLPATSRAGYTFAGWFYDAGFENAVKAGDKMPAANKTLYANWVANTVKVTYDPNGGVNAPAQTDHTFANGADYAEISTAEPTREGYTFLGWYRSTEPNAAKVSALATGDFKEVGGTLTIYAKWAVNAYKVSYVTGNGQVIADANVDYGTALGEYLPQISRTGYDFAGWWVGEVRYDAETTMPAENLTLTAKWTAHTLRVVYSANYQDGPSSLVMNYTYGVGTYQSVAADDTFSREGYTFAGWYRVKEPTDETTRVSGYGDSDYASSSSTITLYAKWNINTYKVSYATNGGSSINVADVTFDAEIPLSATNRTGYTFAGWYYDSEFENAVAAGDKMPAANVTLYAKWTVNVVTVTYNANEGAGSMPASEGHAYGGENYLNLSANAYTREGYTFAGWNTAADGSGYSIVKSGDVYVLPAAYFNVDGGKAVTLYAQWAINAYKVTYVTGNGDTIDPVDLDYGTSFEGKVPSLTRTGYTFAGWFDGETQYTAESTMPASNVTLTAKWVEAEVKLTVSISLENPANLGSYGAATGYDYVTFKTNETVDIDAIVAALIAEHTQYAHYESVNAGNPHSITLDPTGNAVAIKLDLVRHTATFKDGETVKGDFSVAYGTNVLADATFAAAIYRKGYTPKFTVGETVYYDYTQIVIAGDTEIAIGYDVNTNELTANANGGTFASTSKTTAAFESFVYGAVFLDEIEDPVRDGYDFVGWFWDSALTQEAIAMDDGEHDTIYAGWLARTLKVTYVANYDEGPEDFIANLTYDAAGYNAVAASDTFARTGYTFVRWEDGDGNPVSAFNKDNYLGTANAITLYAKWNANTTTVTYNANNGTAAPTATVHVYDTENYAKIATATPTRVGYTFANWNTKADGTGVTVTALSDADFSVDGKAITLYAQWTVNSYALVYDANGGTGSSLSPRVVNYGTSFEDLLPSVTRDGYDFLGWYSGETKVSATTTMPAESVTLVARWLAHTLTVSYDGNGSTSGSTAGSTKTYGVSGWNQVAENGFTKTGYHFVGWNTKADGTGETVTAFEALDYFASSAREVTLYAKWVANTTTVTYYANGGENAPEARVHTYDAANYAKISTDEPDRTGYTFVGWNTKADGTGATVTALNDADFGEDGNAIDLYAQWQVNSYTITYYTDGTPVANRSVAYNEHIVLPETSMTGYTFVGWKYAPMHYASVDDLMPANDIELYAEFQINVHTITIEPGNGSTIDPVENVEYNSGVRSYLPDAVVRAGYDFDGWYIGDVKVDGNTKLPDSDIVVVAHWIARAITVSYSGNGSTGGATANTEATFDEEGWNAVAANGFTKTGYHFDGWYRSAECTGDKVESLVASDFDKAESTLALYVKWVQNTTTVKYDTNGGTNAPADTTHVYDATDYAKVSAAKPTLTGHTFLGWYRSTEEGAAKVTDLVDADFSENGKIVTLYAQWAVNVVKIAYNGNNGDGGLMPTLEGHSYGAEDYLNLTENTFTRVGYTFAGWNTKADGSGDAMSKSGNVYVLPESYFYVDGGKTVTLYAQWAVNAYALGYDADGGSGSGLSPKVVNYGTALSTLLPTVTKDGYEFDGWYLNDVEVDGNTKMPAGDATLVAHWVAHTLAVSYDGNGSTGGATAGSDKTYGASGWNQVAENGFTKTGYHFDGWYRNAECTGAEVTGFALADFAAIEGETTLYAKWVQNVTTVKYDANGGTNAPADTVHAYGAENYAAITAGKPTKTGYTFTGWNTKADGSGDTVTALNNADFSENGKIVTLYAQWDVNVVKVAYNGNGGSGLMPTTENHNYGAEDYLNVTENTFTRAGYAFDGWNTKADGSGDSLAKSGNVYVLPEGYFYVDGGKTVTLYAQWRVTSYVLSFNADGGTGEGLASQSVNYGTLLSGLLPSVTKNGYTFDGWYLNDAKVTASTTMPAGDATLVARWNPYVLTVTYDGNGGTGSIAPQVKYYGSTGWTLVAPSDTFTKDGYHFLYWNSRADGEGTYYNDLVGAYLEPEGTLTLYAIWERNQLNVTYRDTLGTGNPIIDEAVKKYDETGWNQVYAPSKTGYVFDGWYRNAECTGEKVTAFTVGDFAESINDLTLYAKWTPKTITITYDGNGANTGDTVQTVHVYDAEGYAAIAENGFVKNGNRFVEWRDENNVVVTTLTDEIFKSFAGTAKTINLHAVWAVNAITVSYDDGEGSGAPSPTQHTYGATDYAKISTTKPTRDGYEFKGWYRNAECTGNEVTALAVSDFAENGVTVTLYAKWDVKQFDITYHTDGGSSINVETVDYGTVLVKPTPTKTGYTFKGWFYDDGFTQAVDDEDTMPSHDVDLYVKWEINTYQLSYVPGNGDTIDPENVVYGTAFTSLLPEVARTGYVFDGWYLNDVKATTSTTMPAGNATLVAHWTPKVLKVSYLSGGADAGLMPQGDDAEEHVYDAAGYASLAVCVYTKVGHHFAGWYIGDTLVTSLADYFDFAGETGNVSVQAKWVKNTVTVTFENNEGTGTMVEKAHVYQDENYLVLSDNKFTKAGHTFAGWNTKADGTGVAINKNGVGDYVLPGDFFNENADKDVTLYAQWTVNTITLVYNGNGATSGSMGWEERTYGEPGYSDVASTSFSRTGYQFQGWCFNAGGFGDIVTELSDENFAQDGFTLVLYAKWQVVKRTITYHTGLEEEAEPVVVQPVQLDYGTGLSDSLPTLLGVAAPFMGWYYDAEYTQPASTSDRMPDHNIDLYAKWGAVKPLVYFVNGNAVYNAGDYNEDSDFFDYVQDIYNQTEAYDYVYNSVLSPAVGGVTVPIGVAIVCYSYFAQTQGAYGIAPLSFVLSNLLQQASVAQAQAESLAAAFIAAGRDRDKFITINVLGNNDVSAENALQFYALWENTSGDHDSFVGYLTPSIGAENAEAAYQGMSVAHAVLDVYDATDSQEAFISTLVAATDGAVNEATAGALYALFGAYDNMIPMGKAYDGLTTKVFPYLPLNAAYQEYWQTIAAATSQDALNSALSLTSEKREIRFNEYLAYEANGFDPIAQADGYYFDHWEQTVTDDYVERTAVFAYQLPTVVGISQTHTSDSVTFTWDSVKSSGSTVDTNVWGYRVAVTIYRENSSGQYIAVESYEIDRPGVENCEYHVGNLKTHDKVEISIVALWGDKREAIEPKTVTSLIPGKGQVTTASHKLSSEAAQVTYINNEIAEINFDNLHTGDFYSVDPDNLILYLFTDNSYSFSTGGDLLITEDEDHIATVEGGQLITSSKSGSFKLTIGTGIKAKTYSAIVYPLLQSLSLGTSWTSYLTANVSSSETEIKADTSKYYGENKAPITVGAAKVVEPEDDPIASVYEYCDYNTSVTTGEGILATTTKYYNGVKLDIVATSNSGTTIDNKQFKYDVTVTQGTATWTAGEDYIYDDATGAIYFLKAFDEAGYYDVTITAMPSVTNNIYVPAKYLESAASYAKSFNVRVIDGYNVYSHESLYHAYADPSIATINLLANIEVEFSARMVSPVDYIVTYKSSLPYTSLLGSGTTENPYHGEVDIQDNTAYMAAVYSGYKGPKYVHYEGTKTQFYAEFGSDAYCFEAFLPNGSSAVFYYDAAGTFYIDHGAKWIQNVDGGHFKIINGNPTGAQIQTMANYGLEYAFCYDRHNGNAEMTNALTVNGNYFIVDASNLPYVYTAGKVAVTSFTARYNIQNVQACVFANHGYDLEATAESNTALVAFSNLTLYGNTGNTSKYYTGSEDKLKENMEQQSGGINGFASHAWKGDGQGDPKTQDLDEVKYGGYHYGQATSAITLQGVNIYNTLIAAFDDTNMSLDYVHIDNNWANSVYGNGGASDLTFDISHSYIGTSGGAAIHIEDNSIKYDPTVNIDYATTTIENMITGEEPWFKGYGMEVLALGLKGQFESAVQAITAGLVQAQYLPCTYTILQEVTSGAVTSEQMNFAFFSKNSQIGESTLAHHVIRELTNVPAGDFFCYTPDTADTGGVEMTLMFNLKGGKSYLYYKMQMGGLFFIGLLEIFPNA